MHNMVGRAASPAVFAVFCSELSAIGISFSAEILGRRWFGDVKNSEMQPP
jgi:hypothetical protein